MIRWLFDLIYPPRCVLCHRFLESSRESVCDKCGRFVLSQTIHSRTGRNFIRCVAPFDYEGVVRDSVHRFKFRGCRFYAKTYGQWMAAAVAQEYDGIELVTWVPTGKKRRRRRGYDQSRDLCVQTAELLGIPAVPCLRKIRENPPQSKLLDRDLRKKNVAGVYAPAAVERFNGRKILLVDDVITTGATLEECSRVLRKAGAREVVCAALAATK